MAVISPLTHRILYGDQLITIHSVVPTSEKMPTVGQLSQRVTFEKKEVSQTDAVGGRRYDWTKDFTTHAMVKSSTYKKSLEALQEAYSMAYTITIRSKNPAKEGRFLRITGYTKL